MIPLTRHISTSRDTRSMWTSINLEVDILVHAIVLDICMFVVLYDLIVAISTAFRFLPVEDFLESAPVKECKRGKHLSEVVAKTYK